MKQSRFLKHNPSSFPKNILCLPKGEEDLRDPLSLSQSSHTDPEKFLWIFWVDFFLFVCLFIGLVWVGLGFWWGFFVLFCFGVFCLFGFFFLIKYELSATLLKVEFNPIHLP